MLRRKKPVPKIADDKAKIEKIVKGLSGNWSSEERFTSILFDYEDKVVHLETSQSYTARRWFDNLWGDPKVKFEEKVDTLKIQVPWDYCRQPDLILKAKYREFEK